MKARILANIVVAVLERLTEGQGFAGLSVFDAGAGGGFQTGEVNIHLERDGLFIKRKCYDRAEFLELVTQVIRGRHDEKKDYVAAARVVFEAFGLAEERGVVCRQGVSGVLGMGGS